MLTRVATLALVFGLTLAERAEAQTPKLTREQKTSAATSPETEDPPGARYTSVGCDDVLEGHPEGELRARRGVFGLQDQTSRATGTGSKTRCHLIANCRPV